MSHNKPRDMSRFKKLYSYRRQVANLLKVYILGQPHTFDATRFRKTYGSTRTAVVLGDITPPGAAAVISSISPNAGTSAGGTHVVITVDSSLYALSAAIDGVDLTGFAIDDDTHVSGDTVAHAVGAVDVTVTNAIGISSPLVGGFTYGNIAVVSAVSFGVVDTAGGGQRVVVTVNDSTGCTAITAGGVAFTSFAIDDGTHVSGIPGAHAAGVVDVVVTNTYGDSTTGTGLIEYFTPLSLTPTCALMPGDYAVVGTQTVDAVGTWTDSSGNSNNAVSNGGVNAPVAVSGVPDFVAADTLFLSIAQSLAQAFPGYPPDMATLGAGTQINFFEPDLSSGAEAVASYEDAVVSCGSGASAGITYSDAGISWEAYDDVGVAYIRSPAVAAATGVKHYAAGRWNGTTWSCFVNGSAEQTVTAGSAVLSNGNVGASTEIGRSWAGARYFDGRVRCMLVYPTAISNANITKIRGWGQQRGIAST